MPGLILGRDADFGLLRSPDWIAAVISSFVPVNIQGRILPNYATIDRDERIPFWREVRKRVHEQDCKYILQLSHGGRKGGIPGIQIPE